MSPQKPTPEHGDDPALILALDTWGDENMRGDALDAIEALKKAGWLVVRADRYRVDTTAIGGQIGVSKGLPGLGNELTRFTRKMTSVGQEAGAGFVGAFEPVAPGATKAAQTGMEIANRTIAYGSLNPDEALKLALELIGRRSDVVAVQLPEPTHSGNVSTSWGWVTQWHPTHQVNGETRLITVDDAGRCLNVTQARDLAAALLAAAARADAADGAQ